MKILFLFPYPSGTAASQRFRFEQYLTFLSEKHIIFNLRPFLDEQTWDILYKPGHYFQKAGGIAIGLLRRFILLFSVWKYDYVFIHREAAPVGPPVFEWIIVKIFRKKIIYDFDDAIWLPNTSETNKIAAKIKWHSKVKSISRWAYKISAGNRYLAEFALQERRKMDETVVINPTTIDTENLHNGEKKQDSEVFVIGWTGTHSTIQYLWDLIPVLKRLEEKYNFIFLVISDKNPEFQLKSFQFLKWNKQTEIEDLLKMNVGIMPLTDDYWAKGKCGFKALQYMSLCIPPLVSPVGVNIEIVQNGESGFICNTPEDWEKSLSLLIENTESRKIIGKKAQKVVVENYSVLSNRENFLTLFS